MENEAERYNFVQEKSGLSKQDFARSLGLVKSHGSLIGTGRQKLSREAMERMASLYHVNLHWFLTGEGLSGLDGRMVEIEVLDLEAAAGQGREVEDYPEKRMLQVPRTLVSPYRPEKLQGVYVVGDSMIGDNITSGDLAVFYPGQYQSECIHVVSLENSLVVKRVVYNQQKQTIDLKSSNVNYPLRHFEGQELENIRIVGQVIAIWHKL